MVQEKTKGEKERHFVIGTYKAKSICDACGCTEVSVKYRSAKPGREEHIKKTCSICGFVWREKPKWANKSKDL